MANHRELVGAQKRLKSSTSAGEQVTGTDNAEPRETRRSSRLQTRSQPKSSENRRRELESTPPKRPQSFKKPARSSLKRKRGQDADHLSQTEDLRSSKRPRIPPQSTAEAQWKVERNTGTAVADPLKNWVLNKSWPNEYFKQDSQAREDLFERDSWLEEQTDQPPPPTVQYVEIDGFRYPRPIQKGPPSLRRKQSDSSLTGSSDQQKREAKSAPYRDTRYTTLLAAKGSYMEKSHLGITDSSLSSCKALLSLEQTAPNDSLFRDDVFEETCRRVQGRNEARIIRSISPYIVPSVEDMAILGAAKLSCLIENVNEAWVGSIPVEGPRPQPDYTVGFGRSAFTDEQLRKLDPLVGSVFDTSFFVATYRMYFPFLTSEVKCGAAALDTADRQNAHSMTIATRGIVELYKAVKREKEHAREILAFSVSHDYSAVRIYGHYPIIDGSKTTFYRHPIKKFDFTSEEGINKWTAYKFTKNVYDVWMPTHLERICSAIDQLPPNLDFQVFPGSGVQSAGHLMSTLLHSQAKEIGI
ncbi:hypothetical protein A1O3_10367 [Capronia epimyces CBS 606.96]|uniref:DUF7924 domain-containing protein n=1 Tax=Capronia epimyces CBS 606.96 TaxID=1182542 RepID=W9Y411_9EURO|nr:uncharacterized protein A1O3_10367 [Capronia epimyces CBS 606.96]EXJ77209.1 hypothetical protein A1O3_10367 [Capronia epimyces CBS 606.96]